MKNTFLLNLLALTHLACSGQNNLNAWLPEQYVKAMILKDTSAYKYLIPVEGFESFDDKELYILMYKSEINPVKTIKTTINGKIMYQLLNLQYYINLKYNSRELVNRIAKASIYVFKSGDKLLLEINEMNKKETYYFIDRIDGYEFKSIREAKKYLQNK